MYWQRVSIVAVSFLATALSAQGYIMAIRLESMAERVAKADAVVVGKVASVEEKTVKAKSPFGSEVEYQIAIVKIVNGISGVNGLTQVKVAFEVPHNSDGKPIPLRPTTPQPKLQKDQEVCLFLRKHPTESFFVLTNANQILDKKNEDFDKAVNRVKKMVTLMEDPNKSLKSEDAEGRFHTAAMLIIRYRTPCGPDLTTEAIDAAQSKAILEVLAETDLKKKYPGLPNWDALTAFYRLGLTDKDGWQLPENRNEQNITNAVKSWLKANAGSYRIRRFVPDKQQKEEEKGK